MGAQNQPQRISWLFGWLRHLMVALQTLITLFSLGLETHAHIKQTSGAMGLYGDL